MISLDHMILRVCDQAESVRFYQQILAFKHEGRVDPFDILRVHDGFTLDLMEQVPQNQVHLAFCLERAAFEAIHRRLVQLNIPFGNAPFDRAGGPAAKSLGARGMADSLYFYGANQTHQPV
jgi:glyoxylase I family protein